MFFGAPCRADAADLKWSSPTVLNSAAATDSQGDVGAHIVAGGNREWMAIWERANDIFYAISTDDGVSWSAQRPLAATLLNSQPDLATNGTGVWIAAWASAGHFGGDRDILFSTRQGTSAPWTAFAPIASNAATDEAVDLWPHLVHAGQQSWVIVWEAKHTGNSPPLGPDRDLLFSRTTDDGTTWTEPQPLHSNAATDSRDDGSPSIASNGNGNLVAVWSSSENLGGTLGTDNDILFVRSSNAGATWTDPAPLDSAASSDADQDLLPSIATDGAGTFVTTWRSSEGSSDRIAFSVSSDEGASWGTRQLLPSQGGRTATGSSVQGNSDGVWMAVWDSRQVGGDVFGQDTDIFYSTSLDHAATWSLPHPLNSTAYEDDYNDSSPSLAHDKDGRWIAVWRSPDDGSGQLGEDDEVLYSHIDHPCGNGVLDDGEVCDPLEDNQGCCDSTCSGPAEAGGLCRAATDPCDTEDHCNGLSLACGDARLEDGTPCQDGFECTVDDECASGVCTGQLLDPCVTTTTSTTLPSPCADPVPFTAPSNQAVSAGMVTSTDALVILRAAVGLLDCLPCVCDVDGSGALFATDALIALRFAVGESVQRNCPPCA